MRNWKSCIGVGAILLALLAMIPAQSLADPALAPGERCVDRTTTDGWFIEGCGTLVANGLPGGAQHTAECRASATRVFGSSARAPVAVGLRTCQFKRNNISLGDNNRLAVGATALVLPVKPRSGTSGEL